MKKSSISMAVFIFVVFLLSFIISGCYDSQQRDSLVETKLVEKQQATEVPVETPITSTSDEPIPSETEPSLEKLDIPTDIDVPLEYRIRHVFTTEAVYKDVSEEISRHLSEPVDNIVEWPSLALYIFIENLSRVPGIFNIEYSLSTADKEVAQRQRDLHKRTEAEYAELDIQTYNGTIELYLEPGEIGLAICPPGGISITDNRVPFSHSHVVIPVKQ